MTRSPIWKTTSKISLHVKCLARGKSNFPLVFYEHVDYNFYIFLNKELLDGKEKTTGQ